VGELQGHCIPLDDERRPEAGAEPEEEHLAVLVFAECLHDRVVHDLRRLPERLLEVEADPALAEVHGLANDLSVTHGGGDADRDDVVVPVRGQLEHAVDHLASGEVRARLEASALAAARAQGLDVGAADVDGQDLAFAGLRGHARSMTGLREWREGRSSPRRRR
jgi:hypothetical protein